MATLGAMRCALLSPRHHCCRGKLACGRPSTCCRGLAVHSSLSISWRHHRALASVPADKLFDIAGQGVVITGGAQGIGRALAEGFAARGCTLFLLDLKREVAERSAQELTEQYPLCGGAFGFGCDVQDAGQVSGVAEKVNEQCRSLGRESVDVLVNCAGVTRRLPAEDFPLEDFDRIQATNVRGAWMASQQFGSQMMNAGRGGCIINVDSFVTASLLKHVLPYAISKAGVQALTKGLALEWGSRGVRVNGLAPGLILTPISEALWSQPQMKSWAHDQTPLHRMGCAEDLVGTAIFLASPAAKFITGQTIRVDGGLSAGRHWPIDQASPVRPPNASQGSFAGTRNFASMSTSAARREFAQVCADMNYKAGSLVANPFEGDGVEVNTEAGAIRPAQHVVLNGRLDPELVASSGGSLEKRGLCLQRHASAVSDFADQHEIKAKYYPELVAEARRLTGADSAIVASVVQRRVAAPGEEGGSVKTGVRSGAFMVHGDFSDTFKDQIIEMVESDVPCLAGKGGLDLSAEELRKGRLVVLNFWRALCDEPLQRAPLAVCDASSMSVEDVEVYAHDPQPPPLNYVLPLPNLLTVAKTSDKHRWFTFPGMVRDEWVVFKTYDSAGPQPSNGVGVHSAFHDPTMEPGAAARDSIEARVVCFLRCAEEAEDGAKWLRGAEEMTERPPMENVERLSFYRWLEDQGDWNGPVGLTAKFTVADEKVAAFLDIMRDNIASTRQEKGMLQYDLVPDYTPGAAGSGKTVYWLLERFQSKGDLLLHVQSEHYKRCQERFLSDMGGHPLVQIGLYRIDPVEPISK
eukprot:TRINITY_DN24797_c0_g1_i1.p1 TRINITY_DN24797_c0_g1~~TRINITY_DN24797_c0_g1_i1.p1  ORF type:complete len:814 (+),score=141.66 TRINITY_DN24797_c0_g1_i1:25-2442(+)